MVCLDTDVLIDHLRGDDTVTRLVADLEEKGYSLSTTSLNAFELFYGAQKTRDKRTNMEAVRTLLDRLVMLEFHLICAERAGEIAAALDEEGTPIGFRDILVAATALSNGCELMTGNLRHFERIKDLRLHASLQNDTGARELP